MQTPLKRAGPEGIFKNREGPRAETRLRKSIILPHEDHHHLRCDTSSTFSARGASQMPCTMHNIATDRHLIASYPHEPQSGLSIFSAMPALQKTKQKITNQPTNTPPSEKHHQHINICCTSQKAPFPSSPASLAKIYETARLCCCFGLPCDVGLW